MAIHPITRSQTDHHASEIKMSRLLMDHEWNCTPSGQGQEREEKKERKGSSTEYKGGQLASVPQTWIEEAGYTPRVTSRYPVASG